MQGLSITTQRAQLDITSRRAQLNIQNPRPRMRVTTRRAQMSIERRRPTFKVNWEKVRSESGNAPILNRMSRFFDESFQLGQKAVGEIVDRGNQMGSIHTGVDAIAEIAYERSHRSNREMSFNVQAMPQNMPEVEWDMGYTNITWEPAETIIEWEMESLRPRISVDPYSVDIKLARHHSIKISFDPTFFERQRSEKFDKKI